MLVMTHPTSLNRKDEANQKPCVDLQDNTDQAYAPFISDGSVSLSGGTQQVTIKIL